MAACPGTAAGLGFRIKDLRFRAEGLGGRYSRATLQVLQPRGIVCYFSWPIIAAITNILVSIITIVSTFLIILNTILITTVTTIIIATIIAAILVVRAFGPG